MSKDDVLAAEKTRYHVCKNMEQVAQTLRETANLVDAFAQQLNALPLQNIGQAVPLALQMPVLPAMLGPSSSAAATKDARPITSPTVPAEAGTKRKRQPKEGKEKKPKDPNAPKRPPSAYLLYQNDVRKSMQEKFKDLSYREVLTEIAKSWAEMSDSDKKMYNDATASAKNKYNEAKAAYDHPNGQPEAPEAAVAKPKSKAAVLPAKPATPVVAAKAAVASSDEEEEEEVEEAEESSDESSDSDNAPPPKKKPVRETVSTRAPRKSVAIKDDKKKRD